MVQNKNVTGIVVKQCSSNLVMKTVVRASRNGICRYEALEDVIEQSQGKVIIDESVLQEGDYVVAIMTVTNTVTGKLVREKTTSILPAGIEPVEGSSITLPSGTVVGKDSGVQVV